MPEHVSVGTLMLGLPQLVDSAGAILLSPAWVPTLGDHTDIIVVGAEVGSGSSPSLPPASSQLRDAQL